MKLEEIKKQEKVLATVGTKFKITGYRDGSGNTKDVTYEVVGVTGKSKLTEESINILNFGGGKPGTIDGVDDALWATARKEVAKALLKSQAGGNEVFVKRAQEAKRESEAIYITHLREIDVSNENKIKVVKSAPKTLAKQHIKNQLPISSYVYNVKLTDGKFKEFDIIFCNT